jgi:hypothetical protein
MSDVCDICVLVNWVTQLINTQISLWAVQSWLMIGTIYKTIYVPRCSSHTDDSPGDKDAWYGPRNATPEAGLAALVDSETTIKSALNQRAGAAKE